MSRLDDIVARNARPPWYLNKVLRALIIAGLVIVCLVLVALTDLAKPKVDPKKPATASTASTCAAERARGAARPAQPPEITGSKFPWFDGEVRAAG